MGGKSWCRFWYQKLDLARLKKCCFWDHFFQGWCVGHTCFVLCVFLCSALRFFEVANTKTVSFGSFWTLIRISAIREQTSLVLQKKNLILDSEKLKTYENTFFWVIFSVVFLALKNQKMVFSSRKIGKNSFFGLKWLKITLKHCIFLCYFGDFSDFSLC